MADEAANVANTSLEAQRLELERYKAQLDFRKFM
jgi:hypothetical protein